jgi:hypothetical protein
MGEDIPLKMHAAALPGGTQNLRDRRLDAFVRVGETLPRRRVDAALAADQTGLLEFVEIDVQSASRDLGIESQPLLRREAAVVWIVPVAEMPEHDLDRRLEAALLDGPVRGAMSHPDPAGRPRAEADWLTGATPSAATGRR